MSQEACLIGKKLRTQTAVVVPDMFLGVFLITGQLLVWISIPVNPHGLRKARVRSQLTRQTNEG
jgi:hypothetical protein